jgi:DNA-binding GntR family transcriptional regulator
MEHVGILPARVRVAAVMRKAILCGEFKSGEELSLTGIAAEVGVSRTPVREAFQTLEAEGLLELRMSKGAVVKTIDEAFIRDHFEMRMLLEGEAAARAAARGMDTAALAALQHAPLASGAAYETYNSTFHTLIWRASGSPKLYRFCEMLWNGPSSSRTASDETHRTASFAEHGALLTFLQQGNAPAAREAMVAHLRRSMDNILAAFAREEGTR